MSAMSAMPAIQYLCNFREAHESNLEFLVYGYVYVYFQTFIYMDWNLLQNYQAYPNRDITNIVESSHYQKIGGWCRQEGPFQSDALLVPEGCLFDHIHNASRCWPFVRWNQTGAAACQERGMQMRSFAMLLPCGISLFSGVEFVCCPKHFKKRDLMGVQA
ncbi:hypothetical protein GQX74_007125 [Glossina fuscipes]|nr:hypothetical protein GQX74_007125 [Glossina fuscipes]